jgi:hypothetical protein
MLKAQAIFETQLLSKPNVVGVAVGYKESNGVITDQLAVVALVEAKKPITALSADEMIPREVGGVRTDVYEVGYLQALGTPGQQNHRAEFRPVIPAGVSVGHFLITAGTLGVIVRDRSTGQRLILSNNHVLANSNDASPGDAILQPGPMDGGEQANDIVARLERFTPLRFVEDAEKPPAETPGKPDPVKPGENAGCLSALIGIINTLASLSGSKQRVVSTTAQSAGVVGPTVVAPTLSAQALVVDNAYDAALARPVNDTMFSDDILGIGRVTQTKVPGLGMALRKSGRTTGVTDGVVTLLNATVNVAYQTKDGTKTARFSNQVISQAMSQGGDSGSLVIDPTDNKAVGLLFAGSSVATIFTPIDVVLGALNVELV